MPLSLTIFDTFEEYLEYFFVDTIPQRSDRKNDSFPVGLSLHVLSFLGTASELSFKLSIPSAQVVDLIFYFLQLLPKFLVDGFLFPEFLILEMTSLVLLIFGVTSMSIVILVFFILKIRVEMINLAELIEVIVIPILGQLQSFVDVS